MVLVLLIRWRGNVVLSCYANLQTIRKSIKLIKLHPAHLTPISKKVLHVIVVSFSECIVCAEVDLDLARELFQAVVVGLSFVPFDGLRAAVAFVTVSRLLSYR